MLLEIKQAHGFLRRFCISQSEDPSLAGDWHLVFPCLEAGPPYLALSLTKRAILTPKDKSGRKAPSRRRRVLIGVC